MNTALYYQDGDLIRQLVDKKSYIVLQLGNVNQQLVNNIISIGNQSGMSSDAFVLLFQLMYEGRVTDEAEIVEDEKKKIDFSPN